MRSARKHLCYRPAKSLAAHRIVAFLAVLIFPGASGYAATISNRDDAEQKIIIIEGDKHAEIALKPQQVLEKVCLKGCVIQLNGSDDDEYQIEAEDVVSIEDGTLYYDAPEAPKDAPKDGAAAPAPAPAKP